MSGLSLEGLWMLPVLVAGFIGSPHCLAMCGPIAMNFASRGRAQIAYQAGRMVSYSLAGALGGAFGGGLFGARSGRWSLVLIAGLLIFNGYRTYRGRPLHIRLPGPMERWSRSIWSKVRAWPAPLAATAAGVLTVLLPCGHLYGFWLGAVATGSAVKGAAFMFAFWLGSVPLLALGPGVLGRWLRAGAPDRRRRWAGVLLALAGLLCVFSFAQRPIPSQLPADESHHCH